MCKGRSLQSAILGRLIFFFNPSLQFLEDLVYFLFGFRIYAYEFESGRLCICDWDCIGIADDCYRKYLGAYCNALYY